MKKNIFTLILFFSISFVWAQQPSRFPDEKQSEKKQTAEPQEQDLKTSKAKPKAKPPSSNKSNKFMDNARFGGFFWIRFGTYTQIEISPRVQYLVKDNLGVGTGFSYYYWNDNYNYGPNQPLGLKTSGNTWGLNFFSWYNPIGPITLHAEYEPLNFERAVGYDQNGYLNYEREWVHGLLLGGGLRQQSGRANIFILVLYDVLYNDNRSFYPSPWVIRMGVGF